MKKLLCALLFFLIPIYLLKSQDLKSITGSKEVKTNSQEYYWVEFESPLDSMATVTISVSNGKINSTTASNMEEITFYKGDQSKRFSVYWDSIKTNEAFIIAFKTKESGKAIYLKNIKVTDNPSPSNPVTESTELFQTNIAGTLVSGDIVNINLTDAGHKVLGWEYDTSLFQLIEKNSKSIKLKIKPITNYTFNTRAKIKARVEYRFMNILGLTVLGNRFDYTWDFPVYPYPTIEIVNHTGPKYDFDAVCIGESITYELKNDINIFYDTVTNHYIWEISNNFEIIPDYSTNSYRIKIRPINNFRGSDKIKAKLIKSGISPNGKSYMREFSIEKDIWVGPPPIPSTINGFYNDLTGMIGISVFRQLHYYDFTVPTQPYTDRFVWETQNCQIPLDVQNSSTLKDKVRVLMPPGNLNDFPMELIRISVKAENSCGTSLSMSKNGNVAANTSNVPGGIPSSLFPTNPGGNGGGGTGPGGLNPDDNFDPIGPKSAQSPQDVSGNSVSIKIYSFTTGSLVYQNKKAINFNIRDTSLKDGIYIVETTDADGNRTSEKIIKRNY